MANETVYPKKGIKEAFAAGQMFGNSTPVGTNLEEYFQDFLRRNPYLQSHPPTPEEVADILEDYFNSFSSKEAALIERMERKHRTLQQSFSKFVFRWIEHIASSEYSTDGRNKGSQETAQKLMKGWESLGHEQTYGDKPSSWLRMV